MYRTFIIMISIFGILVFTVTLGSAACYVITSLYVGYGCTDMYPCTSYEDVGLFACCKYAKPGQSGKQNCNDGENTEYPYVEHTGTNCGTLPCAHIGGEVRYCNGGYYNKSSGYTDWVPDDTISGTACTG